MRTRRSPRRGSILPLLALCLFVLFAFLALAIDIGMLLAAKTQAQNVADSAATTGARTLNGAADSNTSTATSNASNIAQANYVLGQAVSDGEVAVTHGTYHYDSTSQTFAPQFPPSAPDTYNLTQVTITAGRASAFGNIMGVDKLKVRATGIAAHRPRDVCLVLDYSGSMNNESDLWNNESYLGSSYPGGVNYTSNNLDAVFPQFGHYSATTLALLQTPTTDSRVGRCNVTQSALGVSAMVNDFYQNARGSAAGGAFNSVAYSNLYTPPAGDQYLAVAETSTTPPTFAQTVQQVNGSASSPWEGYSSFQGFTAGPGYWGRTFFIWPPDPRNPDDTVSPNVPGDWRQRFFLKTGGSAPNFGGPMDDNTKLWNSTGNWNNPSGNYVINYKAILAWIKANCIQASSTDGKPFPPQLRAGRILYYDAVPTDVPTAAYDHTQKNYQITWADQNQRFWKEYIDYALGVWRSPMNSVIPPQSPACSYGPGYAWGTVQITSLPATPSDATGNVNYVGGYAMGYSGTIKINNFSAAPSQGQLVQFGSPADGPMYTVVSASTSSMTLDRPLEAAVANNVQVNLTAPFMNYYDNPQRPRHRLWFGPMTMIQFLSDTGLLPGTVHDISMYSAKLGVHGALLDIQNNHPNDQVSLIMFSRPNFNSDGSGGNADPPGVGKFSQAQSPLTRDYNSLVNALYYPPNSGSADVRPWDANGAQTPSANADYTGNTTTNYGFMLAYNQFSGASYSGSLGGFGRKGASRLVILETDGMANTSAGCSFTSNVSGTTNNSYYNIGPGDSVWLDNTAAGTAAINAATKLAALTTDTTNGPGFATSTKPVIIHCLAFGAIFEDVASPPAEQAQAMTFLQQISTIGGTGFPSSVSATSDPNYYKICTGTQQQRSDKLRKAFITIMDTNIPVSLVR